jgi:basic membrane protein A
MTNTTLSKISLSRRTFLGGVAASPFVLSGLNAPAHAAGVTVGMIYVGSRADYGWNQAHAVAAKALKEMPGITVVEEENVPETAAVQKTMESMINIDGATLLFPTSFGYFNPFMVEAAKKFPKIEFRHPTSLWSADKHPSNLGGYFCYLDQAHYVNGIAAGLSTKSNKDRLYRCQADPAGAAQRQFFHVGRSQGQSQRHSATHRHRRLVTASARGGGRQRAGRRRV